MSLVFSFLIGYQVAFSQCPNPTVLPERVCQNSILDFSDYLDENVDGIWHLITNPSGPVDPPLPYTNTFNTSGSPQGVYEFTYIPNDPTLTTNCMPLPTYPVQVLSNANPIIIVQQDVFCESAVVFLDSIVLVGESNISLDWYIYDSSGQEFYVDDILGNASHVWDFSTIDVSGDDTETFKVVVSVNGTSCISELQFTVTLNTEDVTDFSYPDPFCENGIYDPTLGANSSPNGTFSFHPTTPPSPGSSINPSTGRVSGLEEGFYTIVYETSGDCANSSSEFINVTRKNVVPVDDIGLCAGSDLDLLTDVTVGQTGGDWVSFPDMNPLATTSFTNLISDQQFFYQFDVPGVCVTGDTLDVTIVNETSIVFSNTVCNNDNTFDVDVEIGNIGQNYPISIDPPVAGFLTDIDGGTLTTLNLPNDTYTLTVTDTTMAANCETISDSFTNSCGCPEGLIAMNDTILCSGETIALTASLDIGALSAVDLTWSDYNGSLIPDPDNYLPPFVSGCGSIDYVITVDATCIDDNSAITNIDNTFTLTVYPPIIPPTLVQVADPVVDCKYEIATACNNYIVEDDTGNPISGIDLNENDPAGTLDLVVTQANNVCQSWSGTLNYDACTAVTCPEENFTTTINLNVDSVLDLEDFFNEEIAGDYACETCPTASVFDGNSVVDFAGGDLGDYIFSYTFDSPQMGCPAIQYLTVNVVDPTSESDDVIYICSDVDRVMFLEEYLESTNPSAFWLETSIIPSTGNAFDPLAGTFNTASQEDGYYQFAYITTGSTDTVFLDILLLAVADYEPIDVVYDRYICPDSDGSINVEGYPDASFIWYSEITPPDSVQIVTGLSGGDNATLIPSYLEPGDYFFSVIQDVGGCRSAPTQFAITLFGYADPDGNFSILHTDSTVCTGNFVDLAGFANSNTGGTFRYYSDDISTANEISSVVTINTDTTFIIEHETEYIIGATSQFCVDSFMVHIETPTAIDLQVDSDVKPVCNVSATDVTTLDFTAFVNDQSGDWSAPNTQETVDFTDLTNIDFNGLMADTLTFFYTIDGGGSCLPVVDTLRVEVKECTCPNVDTVAPTEDVCQGSSFNLNVLLSNADQSGSWSIVNQVDNAQPAAIDNDSIFNSTGAALGDYSIQFTHTNAPLPSCPDSSVQIITVAAGELAGTGRDTTLCSNIATYDLNINITDANVSGVWNADPTNSTNGTIGSTGEIFPNTMDENGSYLYYFTVNNNSCKDDTARVEIDIISQATATVATQSNACNEPGNLTTLNFMDLITAGDTTGIWTDVDGAGVDLSDIKNVNFESITTGVYTFNYSLANNPCGGANYDVSITVDNTNCVDCLDFDIRPIDDLCSVGGQRILSNKITINSVTASLPGSWSIEPDPTKQNPPYIRIDTVDNAYLFVVDNSDSGEYTIVFSLDTVQPAACDTFKKTTINVVDPPNAGNSVELAVCNTEDTIIDLLVELQAVDTDGEWIQLSGPDPGANLDTVGTFSFLSLNAARGTYVYQYSIDKAGCPLPSTAEVTLYVDGEFDFDVLSNVNICETNPDSLYFDLNSLITINDTGVLNIAGDWTDLDFINAGNPLVNFNTVAPGSYSFEFTPRSGCNVQPQYVDITYEECSNYIFIPSAFSPNNDGLNDFLDIFVNSNFQSLDLKVFNRWGQMMFESNQRKTMWDGLFNKVEAPIGVYTYYVKVVYEDGQIEEKVGDITLVR